MPLLHTIGLIWIALAIPASILVFACLIVGARSDREQDQ